MTFRIQVRRFANARPYTFATCESPAEVEAALDQATRDRWPVIDVEVLSPAFRAVRARIASGESISAVRDDLDAREPQPRGLWRFLLSMIGVKS